MDFGKYQAFLFLIGSVFVPLFAVAAVDFFLVSRQRWDVSDPSPLAGRPDHRLGRGLRRLPARLPGHGARLGRLLDGVAHGIGFTAPSWLGSSVAAIVVGGVVMVVLGLLFELAAGCAGE